MESFLARFVALWTRARLEPADAGARLRDSAAPVCYVLERHSAVDLAVLRKLCASARLPRSRRRVFPGRDGRPARRVRARAAGRLLAHAPRSARARAADRAHRCVARRPGARCRARALRHLLGPRAAKGKIAAAAVAVRGLGLRQPPAARLHGARQRPQHLGAARRSGVAPRPARRRGRHAPRPRAGWRARCAASLRARAPRISVRTCRTGARSWPRCCARAPCARPWPRACAIARAPRAATACSRRAATSTRSRPTTRTASSASPRRC